MDIQPENQTNRRKTNRQDDSSQTVTDGQTVEAHKDFVLGGICDIYEVLYHFISMSIVDV